MTTNQWNEQEFKRLLSSNKEQFANARARYIIALATQQTVEQIDKDSKYAALLSQRFNYAAHCDHDEIGTRIITPGADYCMSDTDFVEYLKLFHAERTKRGLRIEAWTDRAGVTVEAWETSSDKDSFAALKEAETAFIEVALATLPQSMREDMARVRDLRGQKPYKDFLNIISRLDLGSVNE